MIRLFVLLAATPVAAESVDIFGCDFGEKRLEVQAQEAVVSYRFGPPGAPELTLSNALGESGFTPWPGIGRTIFETISFANNGFTYDVFWSLDRLDEDAVLEGGVTISNGGDVVTTLLCDPGSVEAPFFTLGDYLAAAGICWDFDARAHGACP